MSRVKLLVSIGVLTVCVIPGFSLAATFSLSGPGQTGNTITVSPGATFTVNAVMNAAENGNTFEVFLGFDVSSKTSHGLGGTPTLNKLALVSTTADVANSINGEFTVYRSAKVATARENNNSALGGRAYGLKVVGARYANTAGGAKTLFSATFQNNIPAGESYSIVISDAGDGASYTTGWKNGSTTNRGSYVLTISSAALSIPGDANHDGMVDVGDLGILAANYGGSGKTWEQGDFNGDGLVDVGDLGILAANYGTGVNGTADFSADYAKAFGTQVDDNSETMDSGSLCSVFGLPLIAGLLLMSCQLALSRKIS